VPSLVLIVGSVNLAITSSADILPGMDRVIFQKIHYRSCNYGCELVLKSLIHGQSPNDHCRQLKKASDIARQWAIEESSRGVVKIPRILKDFPRLLLGPDVF
jgi:hypothetical protein